MALQETKSLGCSSRWKPQGEKFDPLQNIFMNYYNFVKPSDWMKNAKTCDLFPSFYLTIALHCIVFPMKSYHHSPEWNKMQSLLLAQICLFLQIAQNPIPIQKVPYFNVSRRKNVFQCFADKKCCIFMHGDKTVL